MAGLTPEQEVRLREIEKALEQKGNTMSSGQKALLLKYGTEVPTVPMPQIHDPNDKSVPMPEFSNPDDKSVPMPVYPSRRPTQMPDMTIPDLPRMGKDLPSTEIGPGPQNIKPLMSQEQQLIERLKRAKAQEQPRPPEE